MDSSTSSPLPVPAPPLSSGGGGGAAGVAGAVDASAAAAAAPRASSAFGSSPGTSQQLLQLSPPARGTGHRLWVHAPAIPENLLDEYFSGFGSVVDVYCPRDAQ